MSKQEIPASKIEVGHAIIVDDCDRPETKMIAVIHDIRNGTAYCTYLDKKKDGFKCSFPVEGNRATPVNDFGIKVHRDGKYYFCERIIESSSSDAMSKAKYPDGARRCWQESKLHSGVEIWEEKAKVGAMHTPGPWVWQKFGDCYHLTGQHTNRPIVLSTYKYRTFEDSDPSAFCCVSNLVDGTLAPLSPDHPDSRLIAAAPDLLEALIDVVELFDQWDGPLDDSVEETVRDAVARATGETK